MPNFFRWINLELRWQMFNAYNRIAPLISKTGITKIRLGEKALGYRIRSFLYKVLNFKPPEPIEVNGMMIYYRSPDERGWFGWCYAFDYEPRTRRVFEQIVKRGMAVVDVGAHIGYYSLLAAKLAGKDGRVWAFEPDPAYYTLLKKNIEVNGLSAIIDPFILAVGNIEKKTTLFLGKSTGSGVFKTPDITGQTSITDITSLDKFFADRDWPPVHVIKMDIEGSEKMALEGMGELLRRNRDLKLIIEFNPYFLENAGTSGEDLLVLLAEFGLNRISILSQEAKVYRIPQDIQHLLGLGRRLSVVNLLCERPL